MIDLLSKLLPYAIIVSLISLVDFVALFRTKFITHFTVHDKTIPSNDFTILIPIFNKIKYLKYVDFLSQYPNQVVLCTTDRETPEFYAELEAIASKYKFRIFRSKLIQSVKKGHGVNPWRLFSNTLLSQAQGELISENIRDEIIRESFDVVTTKYCIFVDGDTIAKEHLSKLVGLMIEKQHDLASVRVLASKQDTIMEKLQSIEYQVAMDARKIYPWLTSGAGMVARTEVIRAIMGHHSLFFSGGDIEIGKLAGMLKYNVGHLYFEFYTDVPSTFRAWFKQRMAWFGGGFRHAIVNCTQYTWRHPFFYFYTTVIVYLLTPLKWYELIMYPLALPATVILYWILIFTFHWQEKKWYYFLFPFYAIIQVLVLVPLGVFMYFNMAYRSRNVGIIKLRPQNQVHMHRRLSEKYALASKED